MTEQCGGCEGQGAHRRWCPNVVGPTASRLGSWSMRVDDIADEVGSNDTGTTNLLYAAAGRLRRKAEWAKAYWQGQHTPTPEDADRP